MNWVEFLEANHVEYVTRGPNTKKGEISIRCPLCGDEDPSQHMGISLTSPNWGCLRNAEHRGKSAVALVKALLNCSQHVAVLTVRQYSTADPDNLESALAALLGEEATVVETKTEEVPDLRPIHNIGTTAKYWHYLEDRGFDPDIVIKQYQLKCCQTGRFKDRLIIPYYHAGKMVAWSGRALINPMIAPRYLGSHLIKSTVFNYDALKADSGKMLFVTEGPFDAINVDFYGSRWGGRATCVSGTEVTVAQLALLRALGKQYAKTILLFDRDATQQAFAAADWLGAEVSAMPDGFKDPGELYPSQVAFLVARHRSS